MCSTAQPDWKEYVSKPKKNLTLRLEEEVIRQARVLALKEGLSVSALLARHVEESVRTADEYETARRQALRSLKRGFDMGVEHNTPREELHER